MGFAKVEQELKIASANGHMFFVHLLTPYNPVGLIGGAMGGAPPAPTAAPQEDQEWMQPRSTTLCFLLVLVPAVSLGFETSVTNLYTANPYIGRNIYLPCVYHSL